MKKTVLITGGAGYVGSHTAHLMSQNGYRVIILDTLLHSQSFAHSWATLITKDFSDTKTLHDIFSQEKIDVVMHFAGFIEVGESVKDPAKFYENNVTKTLKLLDTMRAFNVKHFVFSSSCAVYGIPEVLPLTEDHPKNPISPYGKSKLVVEYALHDYARAYDFVYTSLRYFNAAGALPEAGLGEQHDPETHIIPNMIRALQKNKPFTVFGDDFETKDGTCVRDYVHVCDLANVHMLAAEHMQLTGVSDCFNLGTGAGYTVKEMITALETITGQKMIVKIGDRREGDPAELVADYAKAGTLLEWQPKYSNINFILKGVLKWMDIS